jgi:REP element-mobilizing transposase RayT
MIPGQYYHLYNRANAYEKLFPKPENYTFFLNKCAEYIPQVATLYAFALLPNHFHFLIKINSEDNIDLKGHKVYSERISKVFSNLFNSYTKSYNLFYRRRGTLFSRHFKRTPIDSKRYLMNCVLYLHHNAVHHNLCQDYIVWPYTSHHLIVGNPQDEANAELLSWFGGLEGYLQSCQNYIPPPE